MNQVCHSLRHEFYEVNNKKNRCRLHSGWAYFVLQATLLRVTNNREFLATVDSY